MAPDVMIVTVIAPGPTMMGKAMGKTASMRPSFGVLIHRPLGHHAAQSDDEQQDPAGDLQLAQAHVEQVDQAPVADQGKNRHDEQRREDRQLHDVAPLANLQLARQIGVDRDIADRIDHRKQQQTMVNDQAERPGPVCNPPLGRIPNVIFANPYYASGFVVAPPLDPRPDYRGIFSSHPPCRTTNGQGLHIVV